jgi:nucleotide-binding universal stress UspA family protein
VKLDKILVPVDFSEASIAAARRVRSLVGTEARIQLLHVVNTSLIPRSAALPSDLVEELSSEVARESEKLLAELAKGLGVPNVEVSVDRGRPADRICSASESASLVVMGARGRGTLGRALLGSVAEEVARRSSAPVLVVRGAASEGRSIARVVVAVDADDPVDEPIQAAASVATTLHVPLEAIHVLTPPDALASHVPFVTERMRQLLETSQRRIREEAPRVVDEIVTRAIGWRAAVHTVEGDVEAEILRFARPEDLLVCGTHGRKTLGRLAFGSVATKLLRCAPCPVLVVRPGARTQEKIA